MCLLGCCMVSTPLVYWMANSRILCGVLYPIITINSLHWRTEGNILLRICISKRKLKKMSQHSNDHNLIFLISFSGTNRFSVERITTSIFLCWSHDERNTRWRCNEVEKEQQKKTVYLLLPTFCLYNIFFVKGITEF